MGGKARRQGTRGTAGFRASDSLRVRHSLVDVLGIFIYDMFFSDSGVV